VTPGSTLDGRRNVDIVFACPRNLERSGTPNQFRDTLLVVARLSCTPTGRRPAHGLILPWSNHQQFEDWNYFHIRFFRWNSFCSLIAQAGFSIREDLSDKFLGPLPRVLQTPVVNQATRALRRYTLRRWRDLWFLHLLVVCTPNAVSAQGLPATS
jgi:hypothetical protein